jgi:hypothetical protein
MIFRIILMVFLMAVSAIGYTQTKKTLVGFQDIPWGSSVDIIKSKFPQAKLHNSCKGLDGISEETAKTELAKQNQSCISYGIEKYQFEGAAFNLIFKLNSENKLNGVSIQKFTDGAPPASTNICKKNYFLLNSYLQKNHGVGTVLPESMDFYGYKALGFQNHEGELWSLGQTEAYLSNSWNAKNKPDFCWVVLSFAPNRQPVNNLNNEEIKLQCRIQGTEQWSTGFFQKFNQTELITYINRADGVQGIIGVSNGKIPHVSIGAKISGLVSESNKSTQNLISFENSIQDNDAKSYRFVSIDRNTGTINFTINRQFPAGTVLVNGSGTCEKVDMNVRKF